MHMLRLEVVGRVLGKGNCTLVVTKDYGCKGKGPEGIRSVWFRPGNKSMIVDNVFSMGRGHRWIRGDVGKLSQQSFKLNRFFGGVTLSDVLSFTGRQSHSGLSF